VATPPLPFHVTTFRTRSREETKHLKRDAELSKRRYIPPSREVLQAIHGPTTAPSSPAPAEDLEVFPFVRIGDTIELRFKPSTPFDELCQGTEVTPTGQVALGFRCASSDGSERRLEFEILYHSFALAAAATSAASGAAGDCGKDDALVCLRCQRVPGACACGYPSDLLEMNRDWKAKKDPKRRLGLRAFDRGVVGVALRIPRTRAPLTAAERAIHRPQRPNTWNSRLAQCSPRDAKVVMIRMTERAVMPSGESHVLSVHSTYAKLIAKNGELARTK
jgi:hypothetical protein